MKDTDGPTGTGTTRNSDDVDTDPALSSRTFTGSADRVALHVTPARGDAVPGSVEIVDAASLPVGTTAPPPEILVRQLYPETVVPATAIRIPSSQTLPPPPERPPLPPVQGRTRGKNGAALSRRVWVGMAAIVVALIAIGFLALQSFGRTADAVHPSASAPAIVGAPATPAATLAPSLVPSPPVPATILPTSIPSTATAVPSVTSVPATAPVPIAISTAEPTTVPIVIATAEPTAVPTAMPPTSVPNAPPSAPAPAGIPAAPPPQAAIPAATVSLPAIPRLPPAISLPATNIPSVPQAPRKPPSP